MSNTRLSEDASQPSPTALKPCPFCGGEAYTNGNDEERYFVSCAQCYCCVGEAYDRSAMPNHLFLTRDQAIAAWNRRTESHDLRVMWENACKAINRASGL